MAIEGDPDQSLVILTPEPASPTAEALGILASWTGDTTSAPRTPDEYYSQRSWNRWV
jgi:hypothetical protein